MKTKIDLNRYVSLGGSLDKLDLKKTEVIYGDPNLKREINFIEKGEMKNDTRLYDVYFKNGTFHSYAGIWIETEVEVTLTGNYI